MIFKTNISKKRNLDWKVLGICWTTPAVIKISSVKMCSLTLKMYALFGFKLRTWQHKYINHNPQESSTAQRNTFQMVQVTFMLEFSRYNPKNLTLKSGDLEQLWQQAPGPCIYLNPGTMLKWLIFNESLHQNLELLECLSSSAVCCRIIRLRCNYKAQVHICTMQSLPA